MILKLHDEIFEQDRNLDRGSLLCILTPLDTYVENDYLKATTQFCTSDETRKRKRDDQSIQNPLNNGWPIKNRPLCIFKISPLSSLGLKYLFYQKIELEILYKTIYE
jgi:hypothetical protein